MSGCWPAYYQWTEGREPRPLLAEALARFGAAAAGSFRRQAIDLGCGDGTETVALLEAGWSVLALDREPAALRLVQSRTPTELQPRLQTMVASFKDLHLPETDLVYAGYSLPFCRPKYFEALWATIAASIRPGGRFAGQLFGMRDSWSGSPKMTFHSSAEVKTLFSDQFEIELLEEIEEEGEAFSGSKHWHLFDIIARKLD